LVESLQAAGPLSIYALAKRLSRHYRKVYKDVSALTEWMVIEKDDAGRVYVPWDEIDVRWPLLKQVA
jgi:predicted transcriptional regulator